MPLSKKECGDLQKSLRKEWLETNGLGGYAASTVLGCHANRYHGWLVTSVPYLNNRFVLLSKVDASIVVDGKSFDLSTSCYNGKFNPQGYEHIDSFDINSVPITIYRLPELGIEIEQSLMMVDGEDTLIVSYKLLKGKGIVTLNLSPMTSFRMVHSLSKKNFDLDDRMQNVFIDGKISKNFMKMSPYRNLPDLFIGSDKTYNYKKSFRWNEGVEYIEEKEKGGDYAEDLFCLGDFEKRMKKGETFHLYFSTKIPARKIATIWSKEISTREKRKRENKITKTPLGTIQNSLNKFLVNGPGVTRSLVAGYPHADEYGRDLICSIPGTFFYSNHMEQGLELLESYARLEKNGLLPSFISSDGNASYSAVDISFLFFWAIQQYHQISGDMKYIVKHFKKTMDDIVEAYVRGNVSLAELTPEGLIWNGDFDGPSTWMDSKIAGTPVIDRHGYSVEINALWFNALSFYQEVYRSLGEEMPFPVVEILEKIRISFPDRFWCKDLRFLADNVDENGRDLSLRLNQIFAVSLPYSPLTGSQQVDVVKAVEKNLLTPYGLRTLSPEDKNYIGRFKGNSEERARAYHQGSVWPWSLGQYVDAFLKVVDHKENAAKYLLKYLKPLYSQHIGKHGLLSVSEIFDGEYPHLANGSSAKTWNMAEIVRSFEILQMAAKKVKR